MSILNSEEQTLNFNLGMIIKYTPAQHILP